LQQSRPRRSLSRLAALIAGARAARHPNRIELATPELPGAAQHALREEEPLHA